MELGHLGCSEAHGMKIISLQPREDERVKPNTNKKTGSIVGRTHSHLISSKSFCSTLIYIRTYSRLIAWLVDKIVKVSHNG